MTLTEIVDLDQPAAAQLRLPPEVLRWNELAAESDDLITLQHDGNASPVIPYMRPAWSDPNEDRVGQNDISHFYRSACIRVPATMPYGETDETCWERACVAVSAKMWGNGMTGIHLLIRRMRDDGKWGESGINLTGSEALEIAKALNAAFDLIGGAAQ